MYFLSSSINLLLPREEFFDSIASELHVLSALLTSTPLMAFWVQQEEKKLCSYLTSSKITVIPSTSCLGGGGRPSSM